MTKYGQFCPIAKAVEVLGERWTLLIIRELLLGSTRFNELQRALTLLSPTLLTKRLKELQQAGIIVKETVPGQKGSEYRLTPEGLDLAPVIEHLAVWGMKWVRNGLEETDLDAELLMWDIHRRIDCDQLPGNYSVIHFTLHDEMTIPDWWVVVNGSDVDLCTKNPGRDVDLHVISCLSVLVDVWMGNTSLNHALKTDMIKLIGKREYSSRFSKWFTLSTVAGVKLAS